MKITEIKTTAFNLNNTDKMALARVEKILCTMQTYYGENATLQSPIHGDILQTEEIARVRGILSFILDNPTVVEL